ncbi:MAG: hypothetical protein RLZZ252_1157 [Bacteroidota bacterium]
MAIYPEFCTAMIKTGHYLDLQYGRDTAQGWYLRDEEGNEVLLPNKYCSPTAQEGDEITVFIYRDSEDRLVATTRQPKIELYRFACLEVVAATPIGAFLDWGLEKDLFVPFKEQYSRMKPGTNTVVFLYRDEKTDRLLASGRVAKWLNREEVPFQSGQSIEALVFEETETGFKCIINQRYQGMFYKNEVYHPVEVGDTVPGFVKMVRENGLIDVSLKPLGRGKVKGHTEVILEYLEKNNGRLALGDKSSPEEIRDLLGMSKKSFKESAGQLYKLRKINISEHEIIRVK